MARAQNKMTPEEIVAAVLSLDEKEYVTVMGTIAMNNPHPSQAKYITNKFQQYRKEEKAKSGEKGSSKNKKVVMFQRPLPPKPKPGRDGASSRATGSSQIASLLPDIPGSSAWKVPFIFRGDLIPTNGKLFIDVEKLSMKTTWTGDVPRGTKSSHKQVANNVAIVDEKGTLIFWAFIKRNPSEICQYFTSLHRIDRAKVEGGVELSTVRDILDKVFAGNTIVGSKLYDDLKSLSTLDELKEKNYFRHQCVVDIQTFFRDDKGPFSLKDLVAHFFPEKAKEFQKGAHSSISDARVTCQLYLKMIEIQQSMPGIQDASDLGIKRSPKKPFSHDKNDRCRCNK